MRSVFRVAAFAVFGLLILGQAHAQTQGRLVRAASYGTVHRIAGETLLIAEANPTCTEAGRLAAPYCFSEAIAAMRAAGVSSASVMATQNAVTLGAPIQGEIFDLVRTGSTYTATLRSDARNGVRVPRNCFALPGEEVRYDAQRLAAARVALESQLVVCDGAAPRQPWSVDTARPLAIGAQPSAQNAWPPQSSPVISGAPMPFASQNPACTEGATLRDGLCFEGAAAYMQANPTQREYNWLGANVQARDGLVVQRVDQYVIRMRRNNRLDVDERMFDRGLLSIPAECRTAGPAEYRISETEGRFFATPTQRASCGGAPSAPPATAIYEFYGDQIFLAIPGSCPQVQRLTNGSTCFGQIMGYMRQNGLTEMQAISIGDGPYAPGTIIGFRGAGNIGYELVRVNASPDFTSFGAREISRYNAGIRPASGCSLPRDWTPGSEGVVVNSATTGRFFQWYECPLN